MSDTKIEHSEEYRTQTTRSVEVSEADVRWENNAVRAFCGFSISSYRDERDREPELRFEPSAGGVMNRAQWQQVKRLGDLAFAEYEKKWSRGEASPGAAMRETLNPWGGRDPDDLAVLVAASLHATGVPCEIRVRTNDQNEATAIEVYSGASLVASFPCHPMSMRLEFIDMLNAAARSWRLPR